MKKYFFKSETALAWVLIATSTAIAYGISRDTGIPFPAILASAALCYVVAAVAVKLFEEYGE